MDNINKRILGIFFRYSLVILASLGNLFIFYKLFTFPTIVLSRITLSLFGETFWVDDYIVFREIALEIAPSCVAGSAYFLLFVLSLSIPIILSKRLKLIAYCFTTFFCSKCSKNNIHGFLIAN